MTLAVGTKQVLTPFSTNVRVCNVTAGMVRAGDSVWVPVVNVGVAEKVGVTGESVWVATVTVALFSLAVVIGDVVGSIKVP